MTLQERDRLMLDMLKAKLFVFQRVQTSLTGREEPYYAELAASYAFPEINRIVVDWYSELLRDKTFDHICGVETASLALVGGIGYKDNLSVVYLRKKRKTYGTQKLVEGVYQEGDSVYLVDDVTVDAPPTMAFIRSVESQGLKVKGVIVTFKIVEDARCKAVFEQNGYEYYSMLGYDDLARVAQAHHEELGLGANIGQLIMDGAATTTTPVAD